MSLPVYARLLFVENSIEKPRYIIQPYGVPSIREGSFAYRNVSINDARVHAPRARLNSHGFQLFDSETSVTDFFDSEQVTSRYYDEIRALILRETGAQQVHVIDHTIRSSDANSETRGVATHAHNDYTEASCLKLLRTYLDGGDSNKEINQRVIQINAWRPLMEPVLVAPLAVVDGASVSFDDLVACDLVYPDRIGEIYELIFKERHRWYYFPKMLHKEVLLIKGYDSEEEGQVRYTPHAAFSHPNEKLTDPARSSIEVRVIATF